MELPYPEWQCPLEELMLELDREKLVKKTLEVEAIVRDRLRQLQQSNDGDKERQAIRDGLHTLRTIKRERLDYPDWS